MNHIELYEQLLGDLTLSWEARALIKQFYTMTIEDANNTISKIVKLINAKTNDFMK
jgi:hypothetical protein